MLDEARKEDGARGKPGWSRPVGLRGLGVDRGAAFPAALS